MLHILPMVFLFCFGLWLWMRERGKYREAKIQLSFFREQSERVPSLEEALHQAELERRLVEERLTLLTQTQEQLQATFLTLSREALEKNNHSFLELAKLSQEKLQERARGELEQKHKAIDQLLQPIKEGLGRLDLGMKQLEKDRKGDQQSLNHQLHSLIDTEKQLRHETASLVKALREPLARGRWGEIQLKRVVELAGMLNHCDFYEQETQTNEEGKLRPDLLIRLPGGRQVVVDAKVPLEAFLEAVQATDETQRKIHLLRHAKQVRSHVLALSKKAYWESFQPTPEFVILFLPAETFFSAALEFDPTLIEVGAAQGVILATPTTLIALLRSVAYGWKQESLSRHAEQVSLLGHELYKRLIDMGSHIAKVGRGLTSAVDSYNKAVGSLETRVFATARKFKEMGAASAALEIETIEMVDKLTRQLQVPEMQDLDL